jgi:hypothetical protein
MLWDGLYERLREAGISQRRAGSIATDVRDLEEGLAKIVDLLTSSDRDAAERYRLAEEECELHLRWHLKSLQRSMKRLRRR